MPVAPPLLAGIARSSSSRAVDLGILGLCFGVSLAIGWFFSRRQTGTSSYFLGEQKMQGWLVGCSMTASTISAMTFLGLPAVSFKEDYHWVLPGFTFILIAVLAMFIAVPFFRRVVTPSGYAFLEERFGTWARIYAAAGFLLFKLLRLGVVLYATCMALEVFLGIPVIWLMTGVGLVATLYTMIGGFKAVVWTEFFQGLVLVTGAAVIIPVAIHLIPGGFSTILRLGLPAGKMSLGGAHFSLAGKTVWVMIISSLFFNASDFTTRQDFIQRYRAPRTLGQARLALAIACISVVPIWVGFNFLGTVLWTYYQTHSDPGVADIMAREPEKIVPYFMSACLPAGLNGLVLAAISMASLSAIAAILNASAVTWVYDFHERFIAPIRSESQALRLSKVSTGVTGLIMILLALAIHAMRTGTLQDLQATGQMVLSAGLFGLFMVGFFSNRIGRRAALSASAVTLLLVVIWMALETPWARRVWPAATAATPDPFWIPVISNLCLPLLALLFARLFGDAPMRSNQVFFRPCVEEGLQSDCRPQR
jgi:SSS family solute:Na+ symporter